MQKLVVTALLCSLAGIVFISGCIGQGPGGSGSTTTLPSSQPNGGAPGGGVGADVGAKAIITKLSSSASVDIKDFSFSPTEIHLKVGGTVTWQNQDSTTHQVISNSGDELGSGDIASGQTYVHTFLTAGTYSYHCGIHPSMTGTVIVGG